jgi:hypothetical protein
MRRRQPTLMRFRILALASISILVFAAPAFAAKKVAPPKPGAWKILSTESGQVLGHFTVSKQLALAGLEVKTPGEDGWQEREGSCGPGTITIPGGADFQLPISHFAVSSGPLEPGPFNGWVVGASAGSIGGDALQAAETSINFDGVVFYHEQTSPIQRDYLAEVLIVLTSRHGQRLGTINYAEGECSLQFRVKRG